MPIFSRNPLISGEQTQTRSTTGEVASAAFSSAWESGITSNFGVNSDLDAAENGVTQSASSRARFGDLGMERKPSPRITAIEAKQRIQDAGLDGQLSVPATGISSRAVNILIERKREEVRRQTISQQAEGGFWQGSARIGAGFAGTLVDPVNIAAAFVPVVGEARYARLLAGAGGAFERSAIRVGIGAAEGVAGFAPVEAYNYATKQRLQADYTAYDSLLSLASGAAFGSALHAGAGFLGDTVGRSLGFEPEWVRVGRERSQKRADEVFAPVDASAQGTAEPALREADVDPLHMQQSRERAEILDRLAEGRPLTRDAAETRAVASLRDEIRGELLARASGVAEPGAIAAAKTELAGVNKELAGLDGERLQLVKDINARPGVTRSQAESLADRQLEQRRLDLEARKQRAEGQVSSNKDASEATVLLSTFDKGEVPEAYRARVTAEADRLLGSTGELPLSEGIRQALNADPYLSVRPFIARMQPETQAAALRMAIAQAATGRAIDITPALLGDPSFGAFASDVGPMIRERAAVNTSAVADTAAAKAAETQLAQSFKGELIDEARELVKAEEADLQALIKQSGDDMDGALDAINDQMKDALTAGKAAQGAAMCLMRTG